MHSLVQCSLLNESNAFAALRQLGDAANELCLAKAELDGLRPKYAELEARLAATAVGASTSAEAEVAERFSYSCCCLQRSLLSPALLPQLHISRLHRR
jgi:hypothetical protein